jgi:glycerol-3-phosphate dehydrogenase (NAD(P)+)
MKISIFGSGSWATALVKIASERHDEVFWWVREEEIEKGVKEFGHNPVYLRSCQFDASKITISTNIEEIILRTDCLLFVIPAAFLEKSLEGVNKSIFEGKNIISAIKGIVPQTNQIVADFFLTKYGISYDNQAVVSGPSHAEEIVQERLTYLTVASHNESLANEIANNLSCRYVNTTISTDIEGIEYVGVLKNIYALGVGICKGIGLGDNFIAVFVANAAMEMEHFLKTVAPNSQRQINCLVYLGDLLVTAYSQHSRNRTFGQMLGQGYGINSAKLEMAMVAEGYYASQSIHQVNKLLKADMPIAEAIYRIIYKGSSAAREVKKISSYFK